MRDRAGLVGVTAQGRHWLGWALEGGHESLERRRADSDTSGPFEDVVGTLGSGGQQEPSKGFSVGLGRGAQAGFLFGVDPEVDPSATFVLQGAHTTQCTHLVRTKGYIILWELN
jgi:hypothetical protein